MMLKLNTAYTTSEKEVLNFLNEKYCSNSTTPTLLETIQQAAPAVVATVGVVAAVMALAQPPSGGSSGSSGSSSNPSPGVNFTNILLAAVSCQRSIQSFYFIDKNKLAQKLLVKSW